MLIRFIFCALFLAYTFILFSQNCLPGGINFSNQAQIDNFSANYPGCTQLQGSVTISGSDIENLNGLNIIAQIDGDLTITANNQLSDLAGLETLSTVLSSVVIEHNPMLSTLSGLQNLSYIGVQLTIWNCDGLTNLHGLNSLTSLGGFLTIYDNDELLSLTGLDNIENINGTLNIQENDKLMSTTGLSALKTVGGTFSVVENDALMVISELDNLTSVGNRFEIAINDQLTSITGLTNLESVSGTVAISNNPFLTSVMGLNSLSAIGGNLEISHNAILQNLSGLNSLASIGGNLLIGNNNSLNSLSAFNNLTAISGFLDILNNDDLESLAGLDNIDYTTMTSLYLRSSLNLSICNVKSICDFLSFGCCGYMIYGNSIGCNSYSEIFDVCGVLPVELIYLVAQPEETSIRLSWETASEQNNDFFIVEYSEDGRDFYEIAKIPGSGTTYSNKRYTFNHLTPASGFNFYRLKQVDFDGSFEHSHIESAYIETDLKMFKFHPNPTSGVIIFSERNMNGKSLKVYDYAGQFVQNILVKNNSIDLSNLSPGFYFFTVENYNFNEAVRVFIK